MVQLQRVPEVREPRLNCQGTERFGKEKGFKQTDFLESQISLPKTLHKIFGSQGILQRFRNVFWKQRFVL